MRTLVALALVLAACSTGDRPEDSSASSAPATSSVAGPEPFVLRVPRDGGQARVHHFPALDSVVWSGSSSLPAPAAALSFDEEGGVLSLADSAGRPMWIDLRRDAIGVAPREVRMRRPVPAGRARVYGIDTSGTVLQVGPPGDRWTFSPPVPATRVLAQPNGWLLVFAQDGGSTRIWRLHPPQTEISDSTVMPGAHHVVQTAIGDRVYLASGRDLVAIHGQRLTALPTITFADSILDLVSTPSGDRLFVAQAGDRRLAVVDRYEEGITQRVELSGEPRELRMDPFGRYLLARPASGDSAWVITLADLKVAGTVRTSWRSDLPFVAVDGSIVLAAGEDVHVVNGATLRVTRTVAGGASDLWQPFIWDGFRARPDEPQQEPQRVAVSPPADTTVPDDPADTAVTGVPPRVDSLQTDTSRADRAPLEAGFVVSFAALLSEESARELAAQITVDGQRPRVEATERAGTAIFRVLLGPYATRDEAERIGRASGRSYWVYEEGR